MASSVLEYADISPLITDIEWMIMKTSTGKAACMADYYTHWELQVQDALITMLQR